jgi:hypothetical protein
VLGGEPGTGTPEAGHDLIGDEQHTVNAAHSFDSRPIVRWGHARPQRSPSDRLGDECRHPPGTVFDDELIKNLGMPLAAPLRVSFGERTAVLVRCRRVQCWPEPGQVGRAKPCLAGHVEGAAGVAVVGAVAPDD